MDITIYTLTYNEEVLIEFFIKHYKKNFPNCQIVVFDNESTDNTKKIALDNGCEVITYTTENTLSDIDYLQIKNNCWKDSNTDWNIVCDCDELISITEGELKNEELNGTMVIKPKGYSLMNYDDNIILDNLKMGFRDVGFDKCVLFNKKYIKEINYSIGCHTCNPTTHDGVHTKFNVIEYKLLHYKYLHPDYTVNRHKMFGERLSDENKKRGWGIHYQFTSNSIREYYEDKRKELIEIL